MRPSIITGPALALARRRVGLSQIALARALGVHVGIVADWERGHDPIPTAQYEPLLRAIRAGRLRQAEAEGAMDKATQ